MKENHFRHYGQTLQEQARDLRKNMTGPERKLWFCFLKGLSPKFTRQKIIGPYIIDFFCAAYDLAIELDGESHTESYFHDKMREQYLIQQNIRILHFTNSDVTHRFQNVCDAIALTAKFHMSEEISMKTVNIYTDGACSGNPGPGGWGAILQYGSIEKELSGGEAQTTNNRMELTAVIEALRALKEPCRVELYSDSKYFIDAVDKGWVYGWKKKGWIKSDKKPALNVDLWEEILALLSTHDVHLHWVKGHAENEKNNRCDELAVAESKKF